MVEPKELHTFVYHLKTNRIHTIMEKTKLVVVNENTLAYIQPERPNYFCVLFASTLKGATQFNGGGYPILNSDNIRIANETDFNTFNVSFDGYKNRPKEYEFN